MAVPYNTILASVGLRINALTGATASLLETAYITSPLTVTQFQSTIFPFSSIKNAILNAEEKLSMKIAANAEDPLRQYIADVTVSLLNPSTMPFLSAVSKPIIGIWGAVRDTDNGIVCSAMPLDIVRRRAASTLVCSAYWFNLTGGRIEHTRENVVTECCVYSRTDQLAVFEANGNILLADALEPDYISEAVAILVRDDEFMAQAQLYAARGSSIGSLTTLDGVAATT